MLNLHLIKLIVKENTITEHLPTITDRGRTLVPHRFVSEALDGQVKWDGKTSAIITYTHTLDQVLKQKKATDILAMSRCFFLLIDLIYFSFLIAKSIDFSCTLELITTQEISMNHHLFF
ncbi:stalk domain-containing protein [Paenibacillus alvei]|uniref:stalk domain-containing protein n=1 Tax=Paenibacillus alvei TaxID=44250 RepID=UPI003AF32E9F